MFTLPVDYGIDHVNIYLIRDGEGWCLFDTGADCEAARALWLRALAGPLVGGLTRIIVSHHHPDHLGLAGWLCKKWQIPLEIARTEYLLAKTLILETHPVPPADVVEFYTRAGWPDERLAAFAKHSWGHFSLGVSPLPMGFLRIEDGDVLKIGGRAAVVLPDNVLFEAGAGETIRRRLLAECDLHTILRLPTGIFYKPGVKANVLFFDRKPAAADAWTTETWIYDLRTNKHFTLKANPMREADLAEFVEGYCPDDRSKRIESERFRRFGYDELVGRDKANLDITWLRDDTLDDASTLRAPGVLAAEIVEELEAALAQFSELAASLPVELDQLSEPRRAVP